MTTRITVNGTVYDCKSSPTTPLLWVLRDELGLTGTKYGCGIEVCGACTVIVGNQAERSCHLELKEVVGRKVTTIEGLSADNSHPLQKAWLDQQVPQCGYCQSGMIMAAAALLQEKRNPSDSDINEISNVCVCGTYQRIRAAIHEAAKA
jgi:aerobic-type carbon monoxide dehydrogenase small subunit (CoxS/CutS family)